MRSRLQCFQEHTNHRDGTARSAHRTKTATSHIRDASFGDDVGSRALQDAVVHSLESRIRAARWDKDSHSGSGGSHPPFSPSHPIFIRPTAAADENGHKP